MRGEFCVLAGDMNKLLRELLATGDWILVNGLGKEVVEGGPFTRERSGDR